ncbi:MAG: hypothetical protein WC390_11215 [Sulfurimonas sp.]|jgi:hypothetical protein
MMGRWNWLGKALSLFAVTPNTGSVQLPTDVEANPWDNIMGSKVPTPNPHVKSASPPSPPPIGVETTRPPEVETTTYQPKLLAVKCGNVEVLANGLNQWHVVVDGKPLMRMQEVVVTLEMDCVPTVAVTMLPEFTERR